MSHDHSHRKRNLPAQALTLLLIAGILGYFAWRQRRTGPAAAAEETTPESAVWRMVDASRAADLEAYIGCYTGDLERQLRQNVREMGEARFREYLTSTYAQVKGVAVSPPQMASAAEGRVPVEYVYQDRNEVQQVHVRRVGKQWKIFRVEGAERVKTLVPYGTPVNE